jgi:hypothetical protein
LQAGSFAAHTFDGLMVAQGSFAGPPPGDLKRPLDPRNDPAVKTATLPPLAVKIVFIHSRKKCNPH